MVGSSSLMNLVRSPPNLAPDLPFGKGRKLVSGFRAGPWCFSSSGLGAGFARGSASGPAVRQGPCPFSMEFSKRLLLCIPVDALLIFYRSWRDFDAQVKFSFVCMGCAFLCGKWSWGFVEGRWKGA
ncbi:unnamed protein product [Prunus armeniaca]|uniref:Uncharacterized protein n=1 Tax=Prunus armeniaca TaxID=36596 RepID=A0A6J5XCX0_PRUAR|nr:unnamed protein product [Prunus armeniaca]